ncbi:DUF7344 domain-containing protein [Haladaptatus sp.]|uniref:DUF7344 domain-containing protein n=1 Tax=Haladaptatus sp. TaxID=1973141 RepID=UPI003C34E2CD
MVADSRTETSATRPPGELSVDTVLRLVANRRRHLVIDRLKQHDLALTLADLAEEVAVAENDVRLPDIDEQEVLHVYLSLYHNHIPRLSEHGVVEYEQERDLVELSDDTGPVTDLLSVLSDNGFER